MTTTPDPQAVRKIAREHLSDFLGKFPMADATPFFVGGRVLESVGDPELWRTDYPTYIAWCDAVTAEIRAALPSWPDEQPQDERAVDPDGYSITWDHYFVRLWCMRCPDGDDPIAAIPGDPVEMSRLVAEMRDHSAAHAELDAREAKASER